MAGLTFQPTKRENKSLVPTNEPQLLSVASPVPRRMDIDAALETTVVLAAHVHGKARDTSDDIIKNSNI